MAGHGVSKMNATNTAGAMVRGFEHLTRSDVALVGGKNSSLGEMIGGLEAEGIAVPPGFATTSDAYWQYIDANGIREKIATLIEEWQSGKASLSETGHAVRRLFLRGTWPEDAATAIKTAYRQLSAKTGIEDLGVAVRSSATAEDLPDASFAGQLESYLNITGQDALLDACRRCYASLFTDRAISYRQTRGFDHMSIALSVGVQRMKRGDKAVKMIYGSGEMRTRNVPTSKAERAAMSPSLAPRATSSFVYEGISDITTKTPDYFVDKLSRGFAALCATVYPMPAILRMSDFKTNEYAGLIGGAEFEPKEDNPMLGFRGASRYYSPHYKEGFALECRAIKHLREVMGFTNAVVMIPFCRTVGEAKKVLEVMAENGLRRGDDGLEMYVMCEIPSNVILAAEFAEHFDGFSIGSNDLTQLTLGVDRDSGELADLFNEQDEAVKWMISHVISVVRKAGRKIGICGQAPSDHPAFAKFLVEAGINSISVSPDSFLAVKEHVVDVERA
ncbi:hypothetical protein CHGG_06879 [Chaetomium globosum CBS 148.51]|uniref:pyruvate, water dikinase n=1 Tax=Chaetomium globosum (strain ATCC 6205 / CBS 148.51 / DSM 1962 / NBRC 6347 / NRRL 1970) TaxID=306901 RepID=Q2GYS5_CHAGB|nr:uncharacterized protein CHGG_06879 [Chaetomium globosum CBS 148.51]EAQ85626.1 hypothetical protein CHGG_06879 [Chaetomium globosum CBS 148.51]